MIFVTLGTQMCIRDSHKGIYAGKIGVMGAY